MICIRATKYDPSKRDNQGLYTFNEFTSASDVGKKIGDINVSVEIYLFSDDAYVLCVRRLLEASRVSSLRILQLEDKRGTTLLDSEIEKLRPASLGPVYEGMVVSGTNLDKVVRMTLRELIWCKLIGDNGVYVNFGYDYYMYIGSNIDMISLGEPPQGMFYEEMESPYA
ncbi:hypothetical protein [Aquisphaera insulae]|uniref:hypothetical protein n=1 Tax=Aquisphaera insulae TaxID=2712864 RepID=UPI0013EBB1B7|nr:hypothetical protein [Aquisphaera insulae]